MSTSTSVQQLSPSEAVVHRVAKHKRVDPLELTPLYDAIDPDALDLLVRSSDGDGSELTIEFTYAGHDVTVTGGGAIQVDEAAPPQMNV